MKVIQIPTHLNISLDYPLAQWGQRLLGFVLDWAIKFVYLFLLIYATNKMTFEPPLLLVLILALPMLLYSFLTELFFNGQSIGKIISKTKVISTTGEAASSFQLFTRWLFNMVDVWSIILFSTMNSSVSGLLILGPLVGGLVIIYTQNNQRVGDLAANTIVISLKESKVDLFSTVFKYAVDKENYEPSFPQVMRLSDRDITKVQRLLDKGDLSQNEELLIKLSTHVQKVLKIQSKEEPVTFLRMLLADYNYYARKDTSKT